MGPRVLEASIEGTEAGGVNDGVGACTSGTAERGLSCPAKIIATMRARPRRSGGPGHAEEGGIGHFRNIRRVWA